MAKKSIVEDLLAVVATIGCVTVIAIPLLFIGAFVNAFVVVHLWDWFVLTKFTTAPALNMPEAYGLMLIWFFLRYNMKQPQKLSRPGAAKDTVDYLIKDHDTAFSIAWRIFATIIVYPALTLLIGKFVHWYWIVG